MAIDTCTSMVWPLCVLIYDVVIVDNYTTLLLLIGGMCDILKVNCVNK